MNSARKVDELVAGWKTGGTTKTQLMINTAEAEVGWPYCWGATGQYCTTANRTAKMANSRISDGDRELIRKRCQILNGSKSSCSGCAYFPNGEKTRMNDCIAFVNQLLDIAGIDHYGAGCSIMWNTARQWKAKGKISAMPQNICCLVFQQEPGNESKMQHIGFYCGNGYVIHCSGVVKKQTLKAYPWTHFGILTGMEGDVPVPTPTMQTLRKGSRGEYVTLMQTKLIQLGYDLAPYGADGKFGNTTYNAVIKFQHDRGLTPDGIVGQKTWEALNEGKTETYTVTISGVSRTVAEGIVKTYGGSMTKEGD